VNISTGDSSMQREPDSRDMSGDVQRSA